MKKTYSFLLMMVMALVSMSASAKTIHLKVDDQSHIGTCLDLSNYSWISFTNNEVTITTTGSSLLIGAYDGWMISDVTCNGSTLSTSESLPSVRQFEVSLSNVNDGDTIYITTAQQAVSATKVFTFEGPAGLYVTCNYNQVNWMNGAYTVTISENWYAVSIYNDNGLTVRSVTADDGHTYTASNGYVYIPGGDFSTSMHFVIDAVNASEARSAKFNVTLNGDAYKVNLQRMSDYTNLELTSNGTTAIAFDPVSETNYSISPAIYGESIYKVTKNNETVTPSGSYYYITVADGDNVVIDYNYPQEPAHVSFSFVNPGTESAISSIYLNGELVENWVDGFDAQTGDRLGVNVNNALQISSITVNGESLSTYGFQTIIDKAEMNVVVTATLPTMNTVHFEIEDPSAIVVSAGYSGTLLELDADNNIQVPSTLNSISIRAAQGWRIEYIGDDNTGIEYSANNSLSTYDGQVIYVEATKIVRDLNLTVYVEDAAWQYRNLTLSSSNYDIHVTYQYYPEGENSLPVGYSVVPFASFDLPLSVNGYPQPVVYLNDEECTLNTSYGTFNGLDKVKDGDVLKLYASAPQIYSVTYDIADDVEAEIIHDRSRNISNPANHSVTHGTEVTIRPVVTEAPAARVNARDAAAPLTVKLNGEELTPAADGSYTFNVTDHTAVSVSKNTTTGIENVEVSEDNSNEAIYNLQGIRVNGNNLPSGIYIQGGKKVRL